MTLTARARHTIAIATTGAVLTASALFAGPAMAMYPPGEGPTNTAGIASMANANVGKGACSTNTQGGKGFEKSCTGNGGSPEYWCADFAKWVWAQYGVTSSTLTAAAASFYTYAKNNGVFTTTPRVGSVAIFSNNGATSDIHHVAVVVAVSGSTVTTVSGDWNGDSGSEAHFASTSHAVKNSTYSGSPGYKSAMGMYLVGYALA